MKLLPTFVLMVTSLLPLKLLSEDYIIYSISQDFPMGDGKPLKKNYYVNFGEKQGIQEGTILDVYRLISRMDPYHSNKRFNYSVKIGEIEILHSEEDAAIGNIKEIYNSANHPYFEIPAFMIGDKVKVHIKN